MGARGFSELIKTLAHFRCERITALDLSCCALWPSTLAVLFPSLQTASANGGSRPHSSSSRFDSKSSNVSEPPQLSLAALTSLKLDANHLGDEGAALVASALVRGLLPSLTHVSLAHNGITDLGAIILANG